MASECVGWWSKTSSFELEEKEGKLEEREERMLVGKASQSQRMRRIVPEKAMKRGFIIRGSCMFFCSAWGKNRRDEIKKSVVQRKCTLVERWRCGVEVPAVSAERTGAKTLFEMFEAGTGQ
jgi:hypothetical protein